MALISMLLFLAVLTVGLFLIAHAKDTGKISPREFTFLVIVPIPVVLAALFFFRSCWTRNLYSKAGTNNRSASKRSINVLIWLARLAIIVLIALFLNGLLHIREEPLAPRIVGLIMNLAFTFAIVVVLRRLQNPNTK